ncbi:MAG: hypothetical protein GWN87_11090, partial [Desulfuromonadales bacterium]|nr:hypothetical protein [Desulfuromonadales bacterium]
MGAVVLRMDVAASLLPVVQSWPVPGMKAEVAILRPRGNEVLFVHDSAAAGEPVSLPLSQTDLPSVQAVLGRRGMFEGEDYRGQSVLADLRAVPGSAWRLMTWIGRSSITRPAAYR